LIQYLTGEGFFERRVEYEGVELKEVTES